MSKKRFKKAYLEITNLCNLNCSFCPKTRRPPRFSTPEEFEETLRQVDPLCDYLYLHIMGEPLLHPQLPRLLELCRRFDKKVNLTTNGTLLPQAAPTLLTAPALYRVSISLHSFEANDLPFPLEQYLNGVRDFLRQLAATQVIGVLRLWNQDSPHAAPACHALNTRILKLLEEDGLLPFGTLPAGEDLETALAKSPRVRLGERLYLESGQKFAWPELSLSPEKVPPLFCRGLRDQFGVLCDGTVVPCCLDSEGAIPLGNLFEQPLEEILDSPRAKALYDGFSRREAVEPLCRGCGFARRFDR